MANTKYEKGNQWDRTQWYVGFYNIGKSSFVATHVAANEDFYKTKGVKPNTPNKQFWFASANTNSCGTRAMSMMGGLNNSSRFHFLAALMFGSYRWGRPGAPNGKQCITHHTQDMYDSWKPLLDELGLEGIAPFQNSYAHKTIYIVPILLNRDMYIKVRQIMEKDYPVFCEAFDNMVYHLGDDSCPTESLVTDWGKFTGSASQKMDTRDSGSYVSFDSVFPDGQFPVISC